MLFGEACAGEFGVGYGLTTHQFTVQISTPLKNLTFEKGCE